MTAPQTRFANADDGTALAYQVVGDGPVDIVWSFAFLSDVEVTWEYPQLADLIRSLATFSRVVIHDRRGMGRSEGELALDLARDSRDLLAVLDEVGAERPCLGGPVTGGAHSAAFAAEYPDRVSSVVWYGAFARSAETDDYPWGITEQEQDDIERDIIDAWGSDARSARFVEAWAPSLAGDPDTIHFFSRWMEVSTNAADAARLQRFWYEVDLTKVLSSLGAPTLILYREQLDHEEDLHTASLIPNAIAVGLPGTDYIPFIGETGALLDAIRQFATTNA